jgi:small-conductance mechanosensitive channel
MSGQSSYLSIFAYVLTASALSLLPAPPPSRAAPRLQAEPAGVEQVAAPERDEVLEAIDELRLWLPFGEWVKLRAAAQATRGIRDAEPRYSARLAAFEQSLTARAQLRVTIPVSPPQPTAEQLRAHLEAIENTRRNIDAREQQTDLKDLSALELYLGDVLELERALLALLDRAVMSASLPLSIEGPPSPVTGDEAAERVEERRAALLEVARDAERARLSAAETWRDAIARVTQEARAESAERAERLATLSTLKAAASATLADLVARADIERELRDLSLETLIGLRASRAEEERVARAVVDDREVGLDQTLEAYERAHRATLRALAPPVIPSAPEANPEDTFQSAAQLQHTVSVAESFLSFHNARSAATAGALSANEALAAQIDQHLAQLRVAQGVSLTLDVIEALIEARAQPVFVSAEDLAQRARERKSALQLRALSALKSEWGSQRELLSAEATQWRATLGEDQAAGARLLADLSGEAGLRARLEQERVWLAFLKEIEGYDTDRLLEVHAEDLEVFESQERAIRDLRAEVELKSAQLSALTEQRERLSDPLLRQSPPVMSQFEQWAAPLVERAHAVSKQAEVASPAPPPVGAPPSPAISAPPPAPTPPPAASAPSPEELPGEVRPLTARLREQIPPRLTFYVERQRLSDSIEQLLQSRAELITQLERALSKRADLGRHLWRSAALLKRRVQLGQAPASLITEEISQRRSVAWLNELKSESVGPLRRSHEQEAAWLRFEPTYEPVRAELTQWSKQLAEVLDLMSQIAKIAEEPPAEEAKASGEGSNTSLAATQRVHELKRRMDEEKRWYERALDLVHSKNTKALDELLQGLYKELLRLEDQQLRLNQRLKLTRGVFERVDAQREVLSRLESSLSTVVQRLKERLEAERTRALAIIDPEGSIAALSALNQSGALRLSPELIKPAATLEERLKVVASLKRAWSLYTSYSATLTRLNETLAPQGLLERTAGQVKDSEAQLEAERAQLDRPIRRLIGARARGLSFDDLPDLGEIDKIREERLRQKMSAAAWILVSFFLIPFIALLVSRFIRRFGERAFSFVLLEKSGQSMTDRERQERQERSATLFQVFKAASNLLILTLMVIYLLKAVQVDVTPIIASAGVLGLAIAFGAQELVKDFFAGFFILLENQYNIGDVVRIQDTFGKIEQITLRLTIMRDEEGVVHFIPNGQVGKVSNCTREWSQARVDVGVSYSVPPQQVIDCLREIGDRLCVDPVYGGNVLACDVLGINSFDNSAVVYRVRLRVTAGHQWEMARLYRQRVMETFMEQKIEIPFPQVVVHRAPE